MSEIYSINVHLLTCILLTKKVCLYTYRTNLHDTTGRNKLSDPVNFFYVIHLNINTFTATNMEAKMCNPVTIATSQAPL